MDTLVFILFYNSPNFLEVSFYSNNRGAKGFSIVFSFIFMLFVCFYMHDTR